MTYPSLPFSGPGPLPRGTSASGGSGGEGGGMVYIDVTNFDSASAEYVPALGEGFSRNWKRGEYVPKPLPDFSAPWFYAAKIVGLLGIIAICIVSILERL